MFYTVHLMTVRTSRELHLKCVKKPIILSTFSLCDPHVKTVLFNSHCLSLYGGALWNITCRQLTSLEVAFNNNLRWIWKLPRNRHTQILHKIARFDSALIDLYVYLTVFQERPVSRIPICFITALPYSTPMCSLQLAAIATVLANMRNCTLKKTIFVPTLQDTCASVTPV